MLCWVKLPHKLPQLAPRQEEPADPLQQGQEQQVYVTAHVEGLN